MVEAGQVWTPGRLAHVVVAREVVSVEGEMLTYRALGRDYGRVHRLNVADFAAWAAYWGANHG